MSNETRQPTGVPVGGQFATSLKTEPALVLHAGLPPAAFRAEVPVVAHFTVDASYHDELPAWPEGVPEPDVYWEWDDAKVQTSFSFPSGGYLKFWSGSDGSHYNTGDDGFGGWPSELADEDDRMYASEWLSEVHNRVDNHAYGAVVATQTGAVQAAVIAAALGKPQPTWGALPSNQALSRAAAMVDAFNPEAAGLDPRTQELDRAPALRDMLTDLRYWADLNGVDFDAVVSGSGDAYDEETQ